MAQLEAVGFDPFKSKATPEDFAARYGSAAEKAGKALGVDPNVILGQWGLETGWGKSVIPGTNNLGNIKDFSGSGVAATDNMTGSRDKYRQYESPEAFADDFVGLIQRKYAGAMNAGADPAKFTAGLKGYAEDPRYADKVAQATRMASNRKGPIAQTLDRVTDAVVPTAQAATLEPVSAPPQLEAVDFNPFAMKEEPSAGKRLVSGAIQGTKDLAGGLVRGAGSIGATLMAPIDVASDALAGKGLTLESNRQRRADMDSALQNLGVNTDSLSFQGGKLASEVAGTAGVGNALAIPARAAGATKLANALASGGMTVGGAPAQTVAQGAQNLLTRVAGGAGTGAAAAGLVNPEDAGTGALIGGALPVATKVAGTVGNKLGGAARGAARGVKAFVEPFTERGQSAIAARVIANAAGDDATNVVNKLASASELVPGSLPTAAQVAESGGVSALERAMAARNPAPFTERAIDQAAARAAVVGNIAGDAGKRELFEATRQNTAKELYGKAFDKAAGQAEGVRNLDELMQVSHALKGDRIPWGKAGETVDVGDLAAFAVENQGAKLPEIAQLPKEYQRWFNLDQGPMSVLSAAEKGELTKLMRMPALKEAAKDARIIAQNQGLNLGGKTDGSIEGLHTMKLALDDQIAALSGGTAAQQNKAKAIRASRDRLVTFIERMSPDYGEARATYAAMSKPINQMDVGQTLLNRLQPALGEQGAFTRENGAAFANALRNGDQIVKQATGRNLPLSEVLEPQQIEELTAVARDLARKANAQDLGRGVGSNTYQNLAMANIAEQSGAPKVVNALLNAPILRKIPSALYETSEQRIEQEIVRNLLDPRISTPALRRELARRAALGNSAQGNLLSSPSTQNLLRQGYRSAPLLANDR